MNYDGRHILNTKLKKIDLIPEPARTALTLLLLLFSFILRIWVSNDMCLKDIH